MSRPRPHATALILARAGSKGLPGKNIAPVAGKPCIEWTIRAAKAARRIGTVVVSTDDRRAAAIARRLDCLVIDRPRSLASDTATVDSAARHAVTQLERFADTRAAARGPFVILYGNVPVRPAGLIDRALALLIKASADSVQSYAPVGKFHPWWTARIDARSGVVRPWEGRVLNHGVFRRQDLPPAFIPDGGVIALTRRALMLEIPRVPAGPHAFFGRRRRGVINPEGSVIDIDEPIDLLVADSLLRVP